MSDYRKLAKNWLHPGTVTVVEALNSAEILARALLACDGERVEALERAERAEGGLRAISRRAIAPRLTRDERFYDMWAIARAALSASSPSEEPARSKEAAVTPKTEFGI